jgi:uncharacterized damage-inducible protein DinB
MSFYADSLRYQIEFMVWANGRVLSAVANLTTEELDRDFKASENSIRGTLTHIYRAERLWLGRIERSPVARVVDGDDAMAALLENWPAMNQRWLRWSKTLTEESARAELTYLDLRQNTWTQPLWQIILHVVNHSTHHRGQAIGFIRALGHTPPNVDSIMFARANAATI